jgi:hypothetical protein
MAKAGDATPVAAIGDATPIAAMTAILPSLDLIIGLLLTTDEPHGLRHDHSERRIAQGDDGFRGCLDGDREHDFWKIARA